MRNSVICCVLCFSLILSTWSVCGAAGSSSHIYINGRVTKVSGTSITVAGVPLHVSKAVKVIIRAKRNDGFYDTHATTSSLGTGDTATVRIDGNVATEIIIERWAR